MSSMDGPGSQTDAEFEYEVRNWNRKFDEAVLPTNKEVVESVLAGIGIIATIILLPLLCSFGVR